VFLFGPRQTGKSTLLRGRYPDAQFINLLEADTFRELSARPETLRERVAHLGKKLIIIDEVQKLPTLLDEVHNLIELDKSRRFVLTGSSARSLKRKGVNLLGGRALSARLHPLVSWEHEFKNLDETLLWGSLPGVMNSELRKEDLKAYVGTYLQEEIRAEGLVRNLGGFSRFLEVAALCSGQQLNYVSVGNDAQVNQRTVKDYFQILFDTFLGIELPPYRKNKSRKSVATSKFYLFDTGVWNALLGRFSLAPRTREYGEALEHRVFHELTAYLDYNRLDEALTFWRPLKQDHEVDFLIGDRVAIEVKSTSRVSASDLKGLVALSEDMTLKRKIVVSRETAPRRLENGVEILPYREFLQQLWSGEITR
jgi:predicted AAA+ superfamily ATPase